MKSAAVKTGEKIFDSAKNYSLKLLFIKAMYFISGIIISRGTIFGSYYPFGISLSAAVPWKAAIPTAMGAALGYLFPLRLGSGIRYISAIVSVTAVRWTLNDLTKIKNHFLYTPAIVFFSSLITGLAMNSAEGFDGRDVSISFLESFIAAAAAYFFDNTFRILSKKKIYALDQKEFTCVAISFSIALLSLANISVGGVSLGRILAIIMILTAAYSMGVIGGGISGIASGVIFSLPSFGFTYMSGSYAFGGMIAGFFSSFGRIGVCAAFVFANTIISFQSGDVTMMVSGLYESIIAITVFLLIPKSFFNKVKCSSPSFLATSAVSESSAVKEAVVQRLSFASKSLLSVPKFIEKASSEFFKTPEIDFKNVGISSAYSTCSNCGLCTFCWSNERESTNQNFNSIINLVSKSKNISAKDFSPDFLKRCGKTDTIVKKISKSYSDFYAQKTAQTRMNEFKKVMSEQIEGMSSLIEDLSDEFFRCTVFDEETASKIKNELFYAGVDVLSVSCRKDENKRFFTEVECSSVAADKFDEKLGKKISKTCGRKLGDPIISTFGEICRIQMCEQKVFNVDVGVSQHSFNNGKLCGDSYCYFEDGAGKFNVIISDGMGTGGSAAAEGAMASELMKNFIKSGMGFNPSIKLVNSALLLKSCDESLATMDALSLDLFTGEAKFMKAGSPITFIMKKNEIIRLNFESLPIGILSKVAFSCEKVKLEEEDWILMLSDGATDIGEDWIMETLESKKYNSANELSKQIVDTAIKLRKESHDDDITAVSLRVLKNTPHKMFEEN